MSNQRRLSKQDIFENRSQSLVNLLTRKDIDQNFLANPSFLIHHLIINVFILKHCTIFSKMKSQIFMLSSKAY